MTRPTMRLAPSPTGAMHLGHARTFLVNWALARRQGYRLLLRIEDLDGPRVKPDAAAAAIEDLRWLGIDWDGSPLYQRHDLAAYHQALDRLRHKGLVYPCACTRSQVRAAQSAPHGDDHELRYPGTCRPGSAKYGPDHANPPGVGSSGQAKVSGGSGVSGGGGQPIAVAWRMVVPDEPVTFTDAVHGCWTVRVQQDVGDFIVATKSQLPAYQLAVVVDDARQGVSDVVRGDDLLRSTGRQLWLYRFLELGPPPRYCHLPLVTGPDGRRLAKRHGDSSLASYRLAGVSPERVVGLVAYWCGLQEQPAPMTGRIFLNRFSLDRMSRQAAVFTRENHAWLIHSS